MFMTIDEAFKKGLKLTREALGLPKGDLDIKGTDIQAIVAFTLFEKKVKGLEHREEFAVQGPLYAKQLILECYACGADKE